MNCKTAALSSSLVLARLRGTNRGVLDLLVDLTLLRRLAKAAPVGGRKAEGSSGPADEAGDDEEGCRGGGQRVERGRAVMYERVNGSLSITHVTK